MESVRRQADTTLSQCSVTYGILYWGVFVTQPGSLLHKEIREYLPELTP